MHVTFCYTLRSFFTLWKYTRLAQPSLAQDTTSNSKLPDLPRPLWLGGRSMAAISFHDESVSMKFFGQTAALRQAQGKLYAGVTAAKIFVSLGGPKAHVHAG